MPTEVLASLSTCKLCGKQFAGPPSLIIGQSDDANIERKLSELASHLNKEHPQEAGALSIKGAEFVGLLYMMQFSTSDKALAKQIDELRWRIHQQTLNARISDEKLKEQCKALAQSLVKRVFENRSEPALATEFCGDLIPIFTGIRDALQEPGKY